MWYPYHKTTSHNDVDGRVQQHKVDGNSHVAAAEIRRMKGVCSAYDLPEEGDEQPKYKVRQS